jgi:hypothetical protein
MFNFQNPFETNPASENLENSPESSYSVVPPKPEDNEREGAKSPSTMTSLKRLSSIGSSVQMSQLADGVSQLRGSLTDLRSVEVDTGIEDRGTLSDIDASKMGQLSDAELLARLTSGKFNSGAVPSAHSVIWSCLKAPTADGLDFVEGQ